MRSRAERFIAVVFWAAVVAWALVCLHALGLPWGDNSPWVN